MATTENLQAAFGGESQANRKYLAFARKAEADGYHQIARLFRAAAEAETVHAMNHFRALKGVKSTAENIQAAIEGEGYEFREMYPKFLAEAEAEGHKAAIATFKYALAVETMHHALYTQALNALNAGGDLSAAPIFICQVCGNTVIGEAPDECPICRAKKDRFTEIA
jgi:rubrerythrin